MVCGDEAYNPSRVMEAPFSALFSFDYAYSRLAGELPDSICYNCVCNYIISNLA